MYFEESFFEGEEREGFYVEPMMKKAWAAQLEVLQVIDEICTRHNIVYYAAWGTLLGAVRHKGFIPWDDDIDIAMKRADYRRFVEIAERELPKEWDLLTLDKCRDWNRCLARVVNTRHVPLEKEEMEKFHGCPFLVGVDIFPIDNVPPVEEVDTYLLLFGIPFNLARAWDCGDMAENMKNLKGIEEYFDIKFTTNKPYPQQLWSLADRIASLYADDGEAKELTYTYVMEQHPKFRIPMSCYESVIRVPFENTTIPIPVGYEQVLTKSYGDYKKPRQATATHDYPFYKAQREEIYDNYKRIGLNIPPVLREMLGE